MNAKNSFKHYIASFSLAFSALTIFLFVITTSKFYIKPIFPETQNGPVYLPDKSDNFNLLLAVSEDKSSQAFSFFLVNFNITQGNIPVVYLPLNLYCPAENNTLEKVYQQKGFDGVCVSLENLVGQPVSKYICLNKSSLEYITALGGNIKVNLPKKITVSDNIVLKQGSQFLNGGLIYKIFEKLSAQNETNLSSEITAQVVNLVFPLLNGGNGERIFNFTVNNCITNISYKDFKKILRPTDFLCKLNSSPAFSLVLTGKNVDGTFCYDDFSLKSLKEIISGF